MVVPIATWHFSIGPWTDQKIPKMSDTWKPLVLPRQHDDVIMTHVTLFMFHLLCMDTDVICTDVDINNTNVDSSLLTGLG
jgi:hypothetical protein